VYLKDAMSVSVYVKKVWQANLFLFDNVLCETLEQLNSMTSLDTFICRRGKELTQTAAPDVPGLEGMILANLLLHFTCG